MLKQKWFNFRPIALVFVFLLLGSLFAFYIYDKTVIAIISAIVVTGFLLFYAIYKKRKVYFIIPLISFVLGFGIYSLAVLSFNKTINYTPEIIQARVCAIEENGNNSMQLKLNSCKFDGKKNSDNMILYIYDRTDLFEGIEIGSILKFSPNTFHENDLYYRETPNSYQYSNDLKYSASVRMEQVEIIGNKKTLAEKIKLKIKDNLSLGLNNNNTEIAYSALFGDKDLLSAKQYDSYKMSGVAHLLAVSGLHIGIIIATLSKLLELIKIRRWYKFAVISIFLLLYMYICGFAVSVVRASIMGMIALIAKIYFKQYDAINALCIAGIIIFLINPLCVFDVAFLLSFSCVAGISILSISFRENLLKTKMTKNLASGVALSLSTTIAIMFVMAYFFNNLNIISVCANIILIPIFTFAFTIIFLLSILSLVIPYLSYLIYPIDYIFDFINVATNFMAGLPFANFGTINISFISIILYFVILLFVSAFCTAKFKDKAILTMPMIAFLVYVLL